MTENVELRRRVAELEAWKAEHIGVKETLRERETLIRKLTDSSVVGMVLIQDGTYKYANRKMAEIFGYELSEFVNEKSVESTVFHEDWPMVRENLRRRTAGEVASIHYVFRGVRKDGTLIWVEVFGSGIDYQGRPAVVGTVLDITERVRNEEALHRERQRFKILSEHAPYAMVMINKAGEFTYINPKFKELFGYDLEEIQTGRQWFRLAFPDPEDRHRVVAAWIEDLEKILPGENRPRTFEVRCKDSSRKTILFRPVQLDDGGHVMTGADITELKQAEAALRESEERYRSLVDVCPDGIHVNVGGRFAFANRAMASLLGVGNPQELMGREILDFIHPEVHAMVRARMQSTLTESQPVPLTEEKYVRADGTVVDVEVAAAPLVYQGQRAAQAVVRDITDRKMAQERIESALKEKEVLLREIHHRVKNNLQVISSLLSLQSRYTDDKKAVESFRECQERIATMALIHEKLYESEDVANVDFGEYAQTLVTHLAQFFGDGGRKIDVELTANGYKLTIDLAVPCALIIGELVSNCLKHAFPKRAGGLIRISLTSDEHWFTLGVSDNGTGLPENLDVKNPKTMGLRLVQILVTQLKGKMKVHSGKGTEFLISFKRKTMA